jgi:hypothetical protein
MSGWTACGAGAGAAHREAPALAEAHPSLAPQGEAHGHHVLGQPQGASGPGGGHGRQAFGKDAAATGAIAAEPLADAELEAHAVHRPRQIGQGPFITAVETARRDGAEGTGHAGLRRAHQERDLRRGVVDVTGGEA